MTRLDFIETMKVLLPKFNEDNTRVVKFYDWTVYFDDNAINVKVRGKIPYEVAMKIYENYPCEEFGIKAGSIGDSGNPIPFLTDDIYKATVDKCDSEDIDSRARRLERARVSLGYRAPNTKYIDTYRLYSKEGLIAVLLELEKYYFKNEEKETTERSDLVDIIGVVNTKVLDRINPRISGHAWMQETMNSQDYMDGWNRFNGNSSLREFRRALDEFDRTINPFIEGDLTTLEIASDLKDMRIKAYPFDYSDEYKNNVKFYRVFISDCEENTSLEFGINPLGFSYYFSCKFGDKDFFSVRHYYNYNSNEEDKGEILVINYFGDNSIRKKKVALNLTNGTICIDGKRKKAVTELQLASIYLDLVKATRLAANITVNNFTKNKTLNFLKTSTSES